jgi:hypothetical protein
MPLCGWDSNQRQYYVLSKEGKKGLQLYTLHNASTVFIISYIVPVVSLNYHYQPGNNLIRDYNASRDSISKQQQDKIQNPQKKTTPYKRNGL